MQKAKILKNKNYLELNTQLIGREWEVVGNEALMGCCGLSLFSSAGGGGSYQTKISLEIGRIYLNMF